MKEKEDETMWQWSTYKRYPVPIYCTTLSR